MSSQDPQNPHFHPLASTAFTTSGSSGLYDRARPSYPSEAISQIFSTIQISNPQLEGGLKILELGAGTGIFTRLFLSSLPSSLPLQKLIAVEPATGMREGFANALSSSNIPVGTTGINGEEKVQIVEGTFTSIPAPDSWADALVIAQAFHWSHPHYAATLKELARVLKPGAPLFLIWNLEDRGREEHPWVGRIRDIYEKYETGTPQYRLGLWKEIFGLKELEESFDFEEGRDKLEFRRVLETTEEGVVDRVVSKSYITALGEEERKGVEEGVREVLAGQKKVWIDQEKGVFEYPYVTDLYIFRRK